MALLSEVIKIVFGAEDNTSEVIDGLTKKFNQFDRSIQSIAAPAASFVKGLAGVELAAVAAGAALAGFAVREASQFQTSFNEISTLFTGTAEEVQQFKNDILDYSKTSTQSIDSINKAVYNAISAGVDYTKSLDFLAVAERLAVAGKTDLNDASTILISTLNAYGKSTADAADFSDTFFNIVKSGKTTLPELAASLSQVTGTAKSASITFPELGAAIAALTASGAPTAVAITGIRAAINGILAPTEDASKFAEKLGIGFDSTALKTKGLYGVLQDVQKATNGNVDAIKTLFSATEAFTAATILAADGSGVFARTLESMELRAGLTETAFGKMRGNFDLLSANVKNNVKIIAIEIGDNLVKEFGDLPGIFADAFKALGATDAFKPFLDALVVFAKDAQGFLTEVVDNLPAAFDGLDFSRLIDSFGKLGDEFRDVFESLFGEVDLTTVEGLTEALQTGVNILAGFVDITAGIIKQFEPIFDLIGAMGTEFSGVGSDIAKTVGEVLGALTVIAEFGTILGGVLVTLNAAGADIAGVFKGLVAASRLLLNGLQVSFAYTVNLISEVMGEAFRLLSIITPGDLGDKFKATADTIAGFSESFKNKLNEDITDVHDSWDDLKDAFSGIDGKAIDETSTALKGVKDAAGGAVKSVTQLGLSTKDLDEATKLYGDNFKIIGGKVIPTLVAVNDEIKNTVTSTAQAEDKQKGWVKSVKDGIVTYEAFSGGAKKSLDGIGKKTDEVAKKSDDLTAKLAEISSKERVAIIDAKVKLDIASLESETQRVKSAFESINSTIQSTGDVISAAFGAIGDIGGFYGLEKLDIITKQIDAENVRRDAALKMQKELTEAQVDLLRSRSDAISRGDAAIQIDGAGLQPHLEAFMFEILRAIQVRANQEGENFLLGLA